MRMNAEERGWAERLGSGRSRLGLGAGMAAAALLGTALAVPAQLRKYAPGPAYQVLYSFQQSNDGCNPEAGLVRDAEGNLYGTTRYGGNDPDYNDYGTVFKLGVDGTETLLHTFIGNRYGDGEWPALASLILDPAGNVYGTTPYGGSSEINGGIVFKLAPTGEETVLYTFTGTPNGSQPQGGLVRDSAGNLYGTASGDGTEGGGNVFRLSPDGTETVLYSFKARVGDALTPMGNLVRGSGGTFFGTSYWGGAHAVGTIFEATTAGSERVLHSFAGSPNDGLHPAGTSVFRDASGDIYGVTLYGGASNRGAIFKLTSAGAESVLFSFNGRAEGGNPYDGLLRGADGNLFGTALYGGSNSCSIGKYGCGVLFELSPSGQEIVLHKFGESLGDGAFPYGGVIEDPAGSLYGTTAKGGAYGCGTVFKYTP